MGKGVLAVLQARMSSTRLPGKVLLDIEGKPLIYHILERLKNSTEIESVIVAISNNSADDILEEYLSSINIEVYRGSEENVLDRFYQVARRNNCGTIVRLTADNPLIDTKVLDELVKYYHDSHFEYVTTENYPLGLGGEVFSKRLLEEAWKNAKLDYELEHVTPYMYRDGVEYGHMYSNIDYSGLRFTVDTPQDLEFVRIIYKAFYKKSGDNFGLKEIIEYIDNNPQALEINRFVIQKKLGE